MKVGGLFIAVSLILAVLGPVEVSGAAVQDVGFAGASYAPASAPTAEKPQSKLWHHDGRWWGVLFDATNGDYTIHRFNWSANDWTNTGVVVDNRNASHADALSDGDFLYVATALRPGSSSPDSTVRFLRYSYDPGGQRYLLDAGFPVVLWDGPLEAIVIDKDGLGAVWATFTAPSGGGRNVYVTHTTTGDTVWVSPYVLPTAGASTLSSDDISAVVAFRSHIGVMWSNQSEDIVYFATHADGDPDDVWDLSPALQGPRYADDHINLKSLQAGPDGEVVAAVKTELQDPDAPLVLLLVLREGTWTRYTFGRVADDHTRPLVVVDNENSQLYVFAASPCCSGGGIYLKQSPLENISFPSGLGTPFMTSSTNPTINNPTSTKQPVNSTTGLLVVAGDDGTQSYVHNTIPLASSIETTIDAGPSGVVTTPEASFEFSSSLQGGGFDCRLDSAPYADCTSPKGYSGLTEGPHTFEVRATDSDGNPDPTPAQRTWTVDTVAPEVTNTSPVDGATGVDSGAVVEATFSEPIDPLSLTTTTFHLVPAGGSETVPATVHYDATSRTATLRLDSELTLNTEYHATLVGGASGVHDTAGTALPSDRTWAFTTEATDTSPPDTSISDSSPNGTITTSAATFHFSSSEPDSTFECRLQGADYLGCASPLVVVDLEDGPHTFEVRAIDGALNVDPTPSSRSFVVDALIFSDGFESGDLSMWSVRTGNDGSAGVQSDLVKSGSFAARLRATSNPASYSYAFRDLASARTEVTVSADLLIVDEGGSGDAVPVLTLKDAKGTLLRVDRVNGSGSLLVHHGRASFATDGALPLGTWSRLLLRVVTAGPGASTIDLRLDGTLIHSDIAADLGTAGVSRVQIASDAKRRRFETLFDDVTVRR